MPQDFKTCIVWIATCVIALLVFLFYNYMFTQVLRFEGLGTFTAILVTIFILGGLNDRTH